MNAIRRTALTLALALIVTITDIIPLIGATIGAVIVTALRSGSRNAAPRVRNFLITLNM